MSEMTYFMLFGVLENLVNTECVDIKRKKTDNL